VLGGKYPARGVECDPFPVAQPGGEALGGREALPGPIGVVAPDAGARLKLRARLNAGRVWHSVFDLAGIGRRAQVDVERALRIDPERVHRVIAGKRQSGDDHLGQGARCDCPRLQGVTNDAIVRLRIKCAFIKCDPGAAGIAAFPARTETDNHVGASIAGGVLQSEKEAAGGRRVVAVIGPAPGVDVDHPIRRHHHLPRVADIVGEHRCAKAWRQRDPTVVACAGLCRCRTPLLRSRCRRAQQ
jgi:hypothetical protein